jgi:hypothetical protein
MPVSKKSNKSATIVVKPILGRTALGYHVSTNEGTLGYKDGRKVREGVIHEALNGGRRMRQSEVGFCAPGLHASPTPYKALCGGGPCWNTFDTISYVLVRGIFNSSADKFSGFTREYLKVRQLNVRERLNLAFIMGGSQANYDLNAIEKQVNDYLYGLMNRPELYPKG